MYFWEPYGKRHFLKKRFLIPSQNHFVSFSPQTNILLIFLFPPSLGKMQNMGKSNFMG